MLPEELQALKQTALSFLPKSAQPSELHNTFVLSPYTAIYRQISTSKTDSETTSDETLLTTWFNSKGLLLIYLTEDPEKTDPNITKIQNILSKDFRETIDFHQSQYLPNGAFETIFDINQSGTLLLFKDTRLLYKNKYGALQLKTLGERLSQKCASLEKFPEDEQLKLLLGNAVKGKICFNHKRFIEFYITLLMLLKNAFYLKADRFFQTFIDSFVEQLTLIYSVSQKDIGFFSGKHSPTEMISKLEKIRTDHKIPEQLGGVLPLGNLQNVLLMRLFVDMRHSLTHSMKSNSMLGSMGLRAFINKTAAEAQNVISQVNFVICCYMLIETIKASTNTAKSSESERDRQRNLSAFWGNYNVAKLQLKTQEIDDQARHGFLKQLKPALPTVSKLIHK